MKKKDNLKDLYNKLSKHSNYQILPSNLNYLLSSDEIYIKSRYEMERLEFIVNNITTYNQSFMDIGGNTGYFTFELINRGAKTIHFFEGNQAHAEFVKLAMKELNLEDKVTVFSKYFDFDRSSGYRKVDIILLLNVLHHIGDDFGDKSLTIKNAKLKIIEHINTLAYWTETLVLQLGFNWKGNPQFSLFKNGTKSEMINFVSQGTCKSWEVKAIGIPEEKDGLIKYTYLNDKNIDRDNSLGEFLNRPIFILEKKTT